jgi:hypothetical protein
MTKARGASLRRRVRGLGGGLIRRAGLLPGGMPDGLGEDEALLGTALPHRVMVFFPDPPGSLYQLEQWYAPLRALDARHRVVVVLQDSRTARAVRRDSGLDAIVVARYSTMDDLLTRSDIALALYVNQNPENFSNVRWSSMVHASLPHGDSDKAVTVSNLTKTYDFCFVTGRAAVDRMAAFATLYDARARCLPIGRPQLDGQSWQPGPRRRPSGSAPTVLYAPTWEGAHPSVAYGSVDTHGLGLVEAFLDAGWTVIYRPHPLTGAKGGRSYAAADRAIRERLDRARVAGGPHRVDTGVPMPDSFADADLLVCDVSAVAVDWLAVDRPLLITEPARPEVMVARTALTELAPAISVTDIPAVPRLAAEQVQADPLRAPRHELVDYYLGDVRPGAATARFLAEVDRLIVLRDSERARLDGLRAGSA